MLVLIMLMRVECWLGMLNCLCTRLIFVFNFFSQNKDNQIMLQIFNQHLKVDGELWPFSLTNLLLLFFFRKHYS